MTAMFKNHESKWYSVESVPDCHIFGIEDRPGNESIPLCDTLPIIDLANSDTNQTADKIIQASQEYGFFQPFEEISKEANANGWVYMGSNSFAPKGAYMWRDNLKHPCYPLEESMQHWPQNPTRYREVVATYIKEIKRLSLRILEAICEGLGLEKGHLGGMSHVEFLTASSYPPCPDPSLTLGLLGHLDHSLITILFQNLEGLQVLKDGKWIGVEVVPNAFVVNIGTQMQIISNGKLTSAEHRVVTNSEKGRTSIATFINPMPDCIIEPAKVLVNEANPPLYPSLPFKEFVNVSKAFGPFTDAVKTTVPSN
ncbi:hypothetical protein C2S51_022693 [Perilla frutescens var. frutescens]|nr:hypothetical protein C2S51_022693 [Perilla frutescens var. frutescens]